VFDPMFRGKAAIRLSPDGSGIGLYVSQMIAKNHFGTEIRFEQNPKHTEHLGHRTVFTMVYPPHAIVATRR